MKGDVETSEMAGNQLLVGKYVIYQKKQVARVVRVVDRKTCEVEFITSYSN